VWVRYVDHRRKTEPFTVTVRQGGKPAIAGELGVKPVVPVNDEYQLYWGFSFGWGAFEGELPTWGHSCSPLVEGKKLIVQVGEESHAPYDRPPLSKEFLAGDWGVAELALTGPDDAGLRSNLALAHLFFERRSRRKCWRNMRSTSGSSSTTTI